MMLLIAHSKLGWTPSKRRVTAIEESFGESREQAMMNATMSNSTYVIQEGDTLGDIARKHGVPRQALLDSNKLREGQPIYIGETLIIPSAPKQSGSKTLVKADTSTKKAPTPPKKEEKKTAPPKPSSTAYHTVRSGDTLHRISRQYGISVASLKSSNGLKGDVISPGQRLKVPGSNDTAGNKSAGGQKSTDGGNTFAYDNPLC